MILSPQRRADDIRQLKERSLDILVVGGGISGAGAALDAAARGLSVGLVEAQDWAAGTSSRSSKLVHGGLRYLEMMDFALVRQALKERALLLGRLAPHLVHPVPILYPLRRRVLDRIYVGAGIALYDALGWSMGANRGLPWHRHLSRRRALQLAPSLRQDALVGAVEYHDAQVDDARYTIEAVRTAVGLGAVAVSRLQAVRFLREGERVVGTRVRDAESDEEHDLHAKVTILATGAWTEDTEALVGRERAVRVRPSKGVHLMVPRQRLASSVALILRTERSVLFILPWADHWLIGTTDTDWTHDKSRPVATVRDVDYLLEELNKVLTTPLARSDVDAVFAGLRPLVAGADVVRGPGEPGAARLGLGLRRPSRRPSTETETTKVSREHAIDRPAPGVVVVSGGKYTTYRVMAADAVDAAVHEGGLGAPSSSSERVLLLGAQGYEARWSDRARLAQGHGLSMASMEHLLRRYGSLVDEVLEAIRADPSLAQPLAAGYLAAEAVYAVTHEGARHLEDVLRRRTRIAMETPHGGVDLAPRVADLMGPLLGWDDAARSREIDDYRRQAELEDKAATEAADDDEAAQLIKATPTYLPLP